MKKIFLLAFILSSLHAGTIKIALATNVSYAMDDLKRAFNKKYPDIKLQIILGSSGKLTAQISHGAPYQLFISANMKYPKSLYENAYAITKPVVYAYGSLAYFSTKKLNLNQGIKLLKNNNISRIAIANPKTAPYGAASMEAIKNANIYKDVKKKFIYGESISQTLSYTITATDIGLIAKSSLYSPKMSKYKRGINWIDVEQKLYTPINQGIVILKEGKNNKEVKAFYNFIFSADAKKIFKDFGYTTP